MAKNNSPARTVKGVEKLLKDGVKGEYSAGGGLYLSVNGAGSGSWIYRYQIDGKRRRIGLGSVTTVTLSEANQELAKQKKLVSKKIDPLKAKDAAKVERNKKTATFDTVAADYIAAQRDGWKSAKHAQQWERTLATYASPVIGHLAPADITTEHLLEILQPIWSTKRETASRVRNRIELVLNAAKARKLRTGENVATWRGHLDKLLSKAKKKKEHHPALQWEQMPAFWQSMNGHDDMSAQALKLTILTGVRTANAIHARWSEFDLEKNTWLIPAEKMKADEEHEVPLSKAVLSLLAEIPRLPSGYLFEGKIAGKPPSNLAMLMKCRGLHETKHKEDGIGWIDKKGNVITVHGFRSTFRDWAADKTTVANIVAEKALAHAISSDAEAAYRRGQMLERRRKLMESWAKYVTQPAQQKVVSISGERVS